MKAGWEQGLARSLRQDLGLEVHSVTYTSESTFLRDVTRIQPNVILLNKDGPLQPVPLRELLADMPARSPVRIIVINIHNNVIAIYDPLKTQHDVVTSLADLSKYIRGAQRA